MRRFLNMLVANYEKGIYSLRRFGLSRNQFFYSTPQEVGLHGRDLRMQRVAVEGCSSSSLTKANGNGKHKQQLAASEVQTIRLPAPLVSMRPTPCPTAYAESKLDCFPLSESNILFADPEARVFSYDADCHCFVTMPSLHAPKEDPLALAIPGPEGGHGIDVSLYIIEKILRPDKTFQFEALVSHKRHNHMHPWRTWQCHTLPLPPYVLDSGYKPVPICSCAVVGNAICISTDGVGTYCFDTVSHTWSHAGDWMMPFLGKAEHDPELNLWFGVYRHDYRLPCAADLSPVVRGEPPEQCLVWRDADPPEGWRPSIFKPSKMVSLGSGRFCQISFLETVTRGTFTDEPLADERFAVLTGLEVLAGNGSGNGNGKRRLRMTRHKSRRCNTDQRFGLKYV